MNVTLCNRDHPEYGVATIPLPIPDEEYAHCMELLEALEIGSVSGHDCYVDQITEAHPPWMATLDKPGTISYQTDTPEPCDTVQVQKITAGSTAEPIGRNSSRQHMSFL